MTEQHPHELAPEPAGDNPPPDDARPDTAPGAPGRGYDGPDDGGEVYGDEVYWVVSTPADPLLSELQVIDPEAGWMVAALPITVELRDAIDRVVDQQLDAAGVYADGAEDDGEDDEVEVVAVAVDEDDDVVESEPPRGVLGWTKQLAKGATGVSTFRTVKDIPGSTLILSVVATVFLLVAIIASLL